MWNIPIVLASKLRSKLPLNFERPVSLTSRVKKISVCVFATHALMEERDVGSPAPVAAEWFAQLEHHPSPLAAPPPPPPQPAAPQEAPLPPTQPAMLDLSTCAPAEPAAPPTPPEPDGPPPTVLEVSSRDAGGAVAKAGAGGSAWADTDDLELSDDYGEVGEASQGDDNKEKAHKIAARGQTAVTRSNSTSQPVGAGETGGDHHLLSMTGEAGGGWADDEDLYLGGDDDADDARARAPDDADATVTSETEAAARAEAERSEAEAATTPRAGTDAVVRDAWITGEAEELAEVGAAAQIERAEAEAAAATEQVRVEATTPSKRSQRERSGSKE